MASQLDIKTPDGSCKGYLSLPESGRGPGIVLLQEIFGINAYMRQIADLFAAEGFVAVVPDLFWRLEPGVDLDYAERDKAVSLMNRFDFNAGIKDIDATVEALRAHPAVTGKIGVLGYCLGGKLAVAVAARSNIGCAVSYYGVGIEKILDDVKAARGPMMLHYGALDRNSSPEVIKAVSDAVAGKSDVTIYVYKDGDHGFNSSARAAFNHNASLQAHGRTINFLRKYLSA